MNKLPHRIRSNLLETSARGLESTATKWSLRSLAAMNMNTNTNSNANANVGANIHGIGSGSGHTHTHSHHPSSSSKKQRENAPSNKVAEILLREVNVRLACQHKKCLDMIAQVQLYPALSTSGRGKRRPSTPNTVTVNGNNSNDNINNKSKSKRIIRAVNQPLAEISMGLGLGQVSLSFDERREREEECKKEHASALKALKDLEVLHADTFALSDHLLSNGTPTLTRFSPADQSLLAATFEQIRSRHASTVENMADIVIGTRHLEQHLNLSNHTKNNTHDHGENTNTDTDTDALKTSTRMSIMEEKLVEDFLKDRLGIQLLCDHYVSMDKGKVGGGISVQCSIKDVVTDAVIESKMLCDANFGIAPEVQVHIVCMDTHTDEGDEGDGESGRRKEDGGDIHVTLIRPWVHHCLVELLKNAMTSSVQRGSNNRTSTSSKSHSHSYSALPPDVILIIRRTEDGKYIKCEIIDRGVGLGESCLHDHEGKDSANVGDDIDIEMKATIERAFRFASSSSQRRWDRLDEQQSYAMVRSPIASLGVGLTLSRMMMNMFGGDIELIHRPPNHNSPLVSDLPSRSISEADANSNTDTDDGGCTAILYLPCRDDFQEWHC